MRALNVDDAHEVIVAIVVAFVLFGALWLLGSLASDAKPSRGSASQCDIRAN